MLGAKSAASQRVFTGGADGGVPYAGVIQDSAGNLYGTTWSGGPPSEDYPGVVYKVDSAGNFSVLNTFTGFSDGGGSRSNLVLDSAGNLYGTTQYGGQGPCSFFGCGVVFELDPSGHQTVLYSFTGGSDGREPGTGLIRDTAGNLYGTCGSSKHRTPAISTTWRLAHFGNVSFKILRMIVWLRHLFGWVVSAFRCREDLVLENLALRQQLLALHAQRPHRRTSYSGLHSEAGGLDGSGLHAGDAQNGRGLASCWIFACTGSGSPDPGRGEVERV